jgi:predicted DNA-binding protein
VISPSEDGAIVYSCGIALDERTGKPAEYESDEDIEEITDTMEALDFENKFTEKIRAAFPEVKEIE